MRRRKVEVLTQLPPKHRRTVVVKLSTEHAQQLAELKAELRRLDSADDESGWRSMSVFISWFFHALSWFFHGVSLFFYGFS